MKFSEVLALAALYALILASLPASPALSYAEDPAGGTKEVSGAGCFTFGDNDTPLSARQHALSLAMRASVENCKSFVSSYTGIRDLKLDRDFVETLASGYLYDVVVTDESERGREICISIKAKVKPAEIDRLLRDRLDEKPPRDPAERRELSGQWELFSKMPSRSELTFISSRSASWRYEVPEITDNTYAGLGLIVPPTGMRGKTVSIRLDSDEGEDVFVRFYSFSPGFSREDDYDSLVPVEWLLRLRKGPQDIVLEPERFPVPDWWRREFGAVDVAFNPDDVRQVEFEAQVDGDVGPVSDRLHIESITLR